MRESPIIIQYLANEHARWMIVRPLSRAGARFIQPNISRYRKTHLGAQVYLCAYHANANVGTQLIMNVATTFIWSTALSPPSVLHFPRNSIAHASFGVTARLILGGDSEENGAYMSYWCYISYSPNDEIYNSFWLACQCSLCLSLSMFGLGRDSGSGSFLQNMFLVWLWAVGFGGLRVNSLLFLLKAGDRLLLLNSTCLWSSPNELLLYLGS
jgi:hypothetical protein